jgi:thioredoxin 1
MADVIVLTDANFPDVVSKSKLPVVAFFWASWSGPSRTQAPIVDQLATNNDGKVTFGKIDVDANQLTTTEYGVTDLPSLLIFKGGSLINQLRGPATSGTVQAAIDKVLKG